MHVMERINRSTWQNPAERRRYRKPVGFIDAGEETALAVARKDRSGGNVLDIGVGGGRTTQILAQPGWTYTGIDYTASMVKMAQLNYPDQHFLHMDARNMSVFGDSTFDLVFFSFNGIDSVDAAGRTAIMQETARVLVPGGQFVFSTFNRSWPRFSTYTLPPMQWSANPAKLAYRMATRMAGRRRLKSFLDHVEATPDFGIFPHPAHDYGLMVYATSRTHLITQLVKSGFDAAPTIISREGLALDGPDFGAVEFVHVVATKSATADNSLHPG